MGSDNSNEFENLKKMVLKHRHERDDFFLDLSSKLSDDNLVSFSGMLKLISGDAGLYRWFGYTEDFSMTKEKWDVLCSHWPAANQRSFVLTIFSILDEILFVANARIVNEVPKISYSHIKSKIGELIRDLQVLQEDTNKSFGTEDKDITDLLKRLGDSDLSRTHTIDDFSGNNLDIETMFPLIVQGRKKEDVSVVYKNFTYTCADYLEFIKMDPQKCISIILEAIFDIEKDSKTYFNYMKSRPLKHSK